DPGQRFDFDILQRGALDLREVADLRLRELDVADRLLGQGADRGVDLLRTHTEAFRRPLVEAHRVLTHCGLAARGDVTEDAFDGLSYLLRVLGLGGSGLAGLDLANHVRVLCARSSSQYVSGQCTMGRPGTGERKYGMVVPIRLPRYTVCKSGPPNVRLAIQGA